MLKVLMGEGVCTRFMREPHLRRRWGQEIDVTGGGGGRYVVLEFPSWLS